MDHNNPPFTITIFDEAIEVSVRHLVVATVVADAEV